MTGRVWVGTMFATMLAIACASQQTHVSSPDANLVTPLKDGRLPSGSVVWVALDHEIDEDQHPGDAFTATVKQPLQARDGAMLIPDGTRVQGRIVGIRGAHGDEPAAVQLTFERMALPGGNVPFSGEVVETHVSRSKSRYAKGAIGGAAVGVVIGGIVKGGTGALVGGALGAAGGTAIAAGMGTSAELPAGTDLAVRTSRPTSTLASMDRQRKVY